MSKEERIEILSDKMDTLRCNQCSKYFPDPCEDCAFSEVFSDVVGFMLEVEAETRKQTAEEIDKEFARLFKEYKLGTRDVIYQDFHEFLRKKYLKYGIQETEEKNE